MENYLQGSILGLTGEVKLYIFPNENKESAKSPDYVVCIKSKEKLHRVGGLWVTKKMPKEEVVRNEKKQFPF